MNRLGFVKRMTCDVYGQETIFSVGWRVAGRQGTADDTSEFCLKLSPEGRVGPGVLVLPGRDVACREPSHL